SVAQEFSLWSVSEDVHPSKVVLMFLGMPKDYHLHGKLLSLLTIQVIPHISYLFRIFVIAIDKEETICFYDEYISLLKITSTLCLSNVIMCYYTVLLSKHLHLTLRKKYRVNYKKLPVLYYIFVGIFYANKTGIEAAILNDRLQASLAR
ncbi:hypothetical protein L9F63_016415, partial [Diploptera punctata]